jgi:PAS domain S-box-containing protein
MQRLDAIITINEESEIQSFNRSAERIFGYRADEVMGKSVSMLMPAPHRDEHEGYVRNYLDTGEKKIIGIGREVVGMRKDGSLFPLELAVSEVDIEGQKIFTGVVRDISERRRMEQEILRISELERRRIGQDLHDGLGQMLTGIGLISQNLARRLRAEGQESAEDVEEIAELIRAADVQARGLAKGLVPVEVEAQGLSAALRQLARNAERLFGIRCTFREYGAASHHDSNVITHVYRIAQEAVSNAVKHGRASEVNITLAWGADHWRLRIRDNGVGFPEKVDGAAGMGVHIMRYRARIVEGNLDIRRGGRGGTVVTCTIPVAGRLSLSESRTSSDENP